MTDSPRKRGRPRVSEVDRFVGHCAPPDANGCIIWTGGVNGDGYPLFATRDEDDRIKQVPARRHLYRVLRGLQVLPEHSHIRATCNRRLCVAPAHMYEQAAGNWNPPAGLTIEQRRRRAYRDIVTSPANLSSFLAKDWARSQMAAAYGLSEQQVTMIRHHYAAFDIDSPNPVALDLDAELARTSADANQAGE